jgi:triosephosphate isomerase
MATAVWIGTSWKMTKTLDEGRAFARGLAAAPVPEGVQPFVLPAHTSLAAVRDCLPEDSPVLLGVQNAHWAPEGDAGQAEEFVTAQVRAALSRLLPEEVANTIVAYEPVWAIGEAGRPATRAEVSPVTAVIAWESERVGGGRGCRALLYGGSVSVDNATELLEDPHTSGLFVGRAAWEVEGFQALMAIGGAHAAGLGV